MLEIAGVRKSYGAKRALDDLSLSVRPGEYLSLLGPSGSGKSTLLRIIAGFERADAGEIYLDGKPLTAKPVHERGVGFVSQGFALFPHLTVFDNVAFGLRFRQRDPVGAPAEVKRRVDEMLELVGLGELGGRQIAQLSGGQKQRVALARTLVVDPHICLLDEPLGALDANLRRRMTIELRRIHERLGIIFIHVTGNEMEALAMGDRVVVLDQGRALQIGEPDTVYNRPASLQVARFLNRYNTFECLDLDLDGMPAAGGVCCIRRDLITVRDAGYRAAVSEAATTALFVTSEYSGSIIVYLFRLPNGKVVEVEYHLSHKRPEELREGSSYALVWRTDQAMVFDSPKIAA
jgi:ABC-type Fe3+/spermidine/putrescine transport system ATPase subunit